MTVIALAQNKIKYLMPSLGLNLISEQFSKINQGGLFSRIVLGVIALSTVVYLISIYSVFQVGFKVKEQEASRLRTNNEILKTELQLRGLEMNLSRGFSSLLENMEKISNVRYLVPVVPTVSYK